MRVCVFNAKGGVGRTSISLNLAGCIASRYPDMRILVADCDPQGSALAWAALSEETPFVVGRARSRGFDLEILDMAPSMPPNEVLPEADLYLVPTLLDGASFVVFLRTMVLIRKHGLPFLAVANRINPRRAEHRGRLASKELQGAHSIREWAALSSYYAHGKTLFEFAAPHVANARRDIEALADLVEHRLGIGRREAA